MSVLGGKADIFHYGSKSPLIARSGTSKKPTNETAAFVLYRLVSGDLYAAHDARSALRIVNCDVLGAPVVPKGD